MRSVLTSRDLAADGLVLAGLALASHAAARVAERRNPSRGGSLTIPGTRSRYADRGSGLPMVPVHNNVVSSNDCHTASLPECLIPNHRVFAFGHPSFGHSEWPPGRAWTTTGQAAFLSPAMRQLGIERPMVPGHRPGAMVALAERQRDDVAGLALETASPLPGMRGGCSERFPAARSASSSATGTWCTTP